VRFLGDLDDDRRPEAHPRARRQVVLGDVEVDVELVAGERPTGTVVAGDERDRRVRS
jgi:hypothetical protein